MAEFCALWPDGPLFAQASHFRLGTDCVLLSDFTAIGGAKRGIDLGCASGAIMLLLLSRSERLHMTGLELLPEAAALARENMAVSNPPYFPVGSGAAARDAARAAARGETDCTLDDICAAAAWLLRTGGSFSLVHKPERLSEAFCTMSARGIEPKRLRTVHSRYDAAPSLVLIEGRRGGRPGLKIEKPLILTENGEESAEFRRIYHK